MLGTVVVGFGPGRDLARSFEFFDNAEGHEGDDALAVGRMFPDFDAMLLLRGLNFIMLLAVNAAGRLAVIAFLTLFLAVSPIFAMQAGSLGFMNALSAEFERDSFDIFATDFQVIFKVLELEMAPQIMDHFDQSLCHLTFVEASLAIFC